MEHDQWPPEGCVAVGQYAFEQPFIPTQHQVEQAEQFVFTDPNFLELTEEQRRRNVIRLAIAAATSCKLGEGEGSEQLNIVPLIGGVIAKITTVRHEGVPVFSYTVLDGE